MPNGHLFILEMTLGCSSPTGGIFQFGFDYEKASPLGREGSYVTDTGDSHMCYSPNWGITQSIFFGVW